MCVCLCVLSYFIPDYPIFSHSQLAFSNEFSQITRGYLPDPASSQGPNLSPACAYDEGSARSFSDPGNP